MRRVKTWGVDSQDVSIEFSPKVCVRKGVLALSGYDPTSYFDDDAISRGPLFGKAHITVDFNSATYHFVSYESMKKFVDNVDKFLPAFGGFCANAVSDNHVNWVDPNMFLIQDNRLLMFHDQEDADNWDSDSATQLAAADTHWKAGTFLFKK